MDAAVLGEGNKGAALGAGDADIGEAAFLFQAGAAFFVERALVGKQAFFPAGRKTVPNSSPLAECRVMMLTLSSLVAGHGIHDEGNMLEEARHVSNSPIERTSSFRFSSRPCASGLLSSCHMPV